MVVLNREIRGPFDHFAEMSIGKSRIVPIVVLVISIANVPYFTTIGNVFDY